MVKAKSPPTFGRFTPDPDVYMSYSNAISRGDFPVALDLLHNLLFNPAIRNLNKKGLEIDAVWHSSKTKLGAIRSQIDNSRGQTDFVHGLLSAIQGSLALMARNKAGTGPTVSPEEFIAHGVALGRLLAQANDVDNETYEKGHAAWREQTSAYFSRQAGGEKTRKWAPIGEQYIRDNPGKSRTAIANMIADDHGGDPATISRALKPLFAPAEPSPYPTDEQYYAAVAALEKEQ